MPSGVLVRTVQSAGDRHAPAQRLPRAILSRVRRGQTTAAQSALVGKGTPLSLRRVPGHIQSDSSRRMTEEDRMKLVHYGRHVARAPCETCRQPRPAEWKTLCGVKAIYARAVTCSAAEQILYVHRSPAGPDGLLSYVWDRKVLSVNPGYCFKCAGWHVAGRAGCCPHMRSRNYNGQKTLLHKPVKP
jgi:hypothetical protein